MEIIKHGKTYEKQQVKICSQCEFSYKKNEIKQNWVRTKSEDSDLVFTYINCPEYGKRIIIEDFRKTIE